MKKIISIVLIVIFIFVLCACGGGDSGKETQSVESKVMERVRAQITAKVLLQYDTVGSPNITCYVNEAGENKYRVTGTVTVRDRYGDSYTGKYDAMVNTYSDTVDLNLGTLYKK